MLQYIWIPWYLRIRFQFCQWIKWKALLIWNGTYWERSTCPHPQKGEKMSFVWSDNGCTVKSKERWYLEIKSQYISGIYLNESNFCVIYMTLSRSEKNMFSWFNWFRNESPLDIFSLPVPTIALRLELNRER